MQAHYSLGLAAALVCCSCGGTTPSAPSTNGVTTPDISGNYNLTVTRCSLPGETTAVPMRFVCGADNIWALNRNGSVVTGTNTTRCPPFVASGSLTGQMRGDGTFEITTLNYTGGSTHSDEETLAVKGTAVANFFGYAGMLGGDYTSTPIFGSAKGPTKSCHGEGMAFQLLRRN